MGVGRGDEGNMGEEEVSQRWGNILSGYAMNLFDLGTDPGHNRVCMRRVYGVISVYWLEPTAWLCLDACAPTQDDSLLVLLR